jgi:transposase
MAMEFLSFHNQLVAVFPPHDEDDDLLAFHSMQGTQVSDPQLKVRQRIGSQPLDGGIEDTAGYGVLRRQGAGVHRGARPPAWRPHGARRDSRPLKAEDTSPENFGLRSGWHLFPHLFPRLMEAGYHVELVNTSAVRQYEGLKYVDDRHDARWLARLLQLGILPTGYIYPKEQRALRDLLRRRTFLVSQRTANLLSIKNLYSRLTGAQVPTKDLKRLTAEQVAEQFPDPLLAQAITCGVNVAGALKTEIANLEKTILAQARQRPEYALLESIPGIGQTLAMTILYETGSLSRFPDAAKMARACFYVLRDQVPFQAA